jgi:hypothetical protein
MFGITLRLSGGEDVAMSVSAERVIEETGAPDTEPVERLDVADLGPPKPLKNTLETLADMDGGVLVQYNDRAPQHLYPKLDDRGYAYETVEYEDVIVTVIWPA